MEVARASRKHMEVVLIGHAGHPEVEGTMGQYSSDQGGMYLVETPADVIGLVDKVKDPTHLHYVSQTTLSVDETADVIEELRPGFFHISKVRVKMIFATRPKIVKMLCEIWQSMLML